MAAALGEELLEPAPVEGVDRVGGEQEILERIPGGAPGEIDDRPGRGGAGDAVADQAIAAIDIAAMDADARMVAAPAGRVGDLDEGWVGFAESQAGSGCPAGQQRARPAGERGGEPARAPAGGRLGASEWPGFPA